jgi:hypothetical protein
MTRPVAVGVVLVMTAAVAMQVGSSSYMIKQPSAGYAAK